MAKKESRKPEYRLKFLNKKTEERGEIGAGWSNSDGSISVVLNPKVCWFQDADLEVRLFPNDRE